MAAFLGQSSSVCTENTSDRASLSAGALTRIRVAAVPPGGRAISAGAATLRDLMLPLGLLGAGFAWLVLTLFRHVEPPSRLGLTLPGRPCHKHQRRPHGRSDALASTKMHE